MLAGKPTLNEMSSVVMGHRFLFYAQLGCDEFHVCPLLFHSRSVVMKNNAAAPPIPPAIAIALGPPYTKNTVFFRYKDEKFVNSI